MKSPRGTQGPGPQRPSARAALAHLVATCVFVLAVAVASSAVVALVGNPQPTVADPGRPAPKWVTTWTSMPQLTEPGNMPPAPFTGERATLVDTTLRQTVRVSTGGERIRLCFSNAFGTTPLPLTAVTVALPQDDPAGLRETTRQATTGSAPQAPSTPSSTGPSAIRPTPDGCARTSTTGTGCI